MTSRPRILIAIEPPLLADLVRRSLVQEDVDVDLTSRSQAAVGAWDIAVVSPSGQDYVHARHVIDPATLDGGTFDSLVALVRSLCGR